MKKSGMGAAIFSHLSFFLLMNLVFNTTVYAQQPFYQGKSVRLIAGTTAGTVTDLWPRLIAEHMGKHIAGNPGVVVQNMPGAGGVIAANYVYNVAKPDGLTLGTVSPSIYVDQIVGRRRFNSTGGNSIGSARRNSTTTSLLCARIVLTKASTIYVKPQNHPSAALRGRARISTKYLNSWKRLWARNF
jgi:hypothetical protein